MRKAQSGQSRVFFRELGKRGDHVDHLFAQHDESVVIDDGVRVVGDEAARRAQMDDGHRRGALLSVSIDVCHHVMTHDFFSCARDIEIDVVDMRLHLRDLFVGYVESQLLFALRERYPELAPKDHAVLFTEIFQHGLGRVASGKRIGIGHCHKVHLAKILLIYITL